MDVASVRLPQAVYGKGQEWYSVLWLLGLVKA